MATDNNGTDESTIRDMLNLGRERVADTAEELLEDSKERLEDLAESVQPRVAEGLKRAGELSDLTKETYTGILECAKGENHLWYQMWTAGTGALTDSAKGLLGSKPSELKSKNTLSYVGGILGGGVLSVLSIIPVAIVEETIRYAAKKIAEKK